MRYIDYGIAVLNAAVFASFPDNMAFDLADVTPVSSQKTAGGVK
jgi:hypothetical protein